MRSASRSEGRVERVTCSNCGGDGHHGDDTMKCDQCRGRGVTGPNGDPLPGDMWGAYEDIWTGNLWM